MGNCFSFCWPSKEEYTPSPEDDSEMKQPLLTSTKDYGTSEIEEASPALDPTHEDHNSDDQGSSLEEPESLEETKYEVFKIPEEEVELYRFTSFSTAASNTKTFDPDFAGSSPNSSPKSSPSPPFRSSASSNLLRSSPPPRKSSTTHRNSQRFTFFPKIEDNDEGSSRDTSPQLTRSSVLPRSASPSASPILTASAPPSLTEKVRSFLTPKLERHKATSSSSQLSVNTPPAHRSTQRSALTSYSSSKLHSSNDSYSTSGDSFRLDNSSPASIQTSLSSSGIVFPTTVREQQKQNLQPKNPQSEHSKSELFKKEPNPYVPLEDASEAEFSKKKVSFVDESRVKLRRSGTAGPALTRNRPSAEVLGENVALMIRKELSEEKSRTESEISESKEEEEEEEDGNEVDLEKATPKCHRDLTVQEIFTTESSYVNSLRNLVKGVVVPLETSKIVDHDQVATVFSNIREILNVNEMLLAELGERIKHWSSKQKIGDIFLRMVPFLKVYTYYSTRYDRAIVLLKELRQKNSALDDFLKKWESKPESGRLPMDSFLILPIQRIPRYSMLFKGLVKRTKESHPDYEGINSVYAKMEELATGLNEGIRRYENQQVLFQVAELIKSPFHNLHLVQPHRLLLKKGMLMKVCRKSVKKRWVFLFNDILLYCSEGPFGSYIHHLSMNLLWVTVVDMPDQESKGWYNSLQVNGHEKSFVLLAPNAKEKTAWITSIQNAAEDLQTKKDKLINVESDQPYVSPVWEPDSEKTSCSLCSAKFTVFKRRHHCRKCGQLICDDCSRKVKLSSQFNATRVCVNCQQAAQQLFLAEKKRSNAPSLTFGRSHSLSEKPKDERELSIPPFQLPIDKVEVGSSLSVLSNISSLSSLSSPSPLSSPHSPSSSYSSSGSHNSLLSQPSNNDLSLS